MGIEEGCLLWGSKVVVPHLGRDLTLQITHKAHPGIVRMKSLARSYIWWPGLDKNIETCVKKFTICQSSRKDTPSAPISPMASAVDHDIHRQCRSIRRQNVSTDD